MDNKLIFKYPRDAKSLLDSAEGRRIHFAVMAIESGASKMGISGQEMHARLKAQNLIHNRLLARYDILHTQSREWVAEDIVETLRNWEAEEYKDSLQLPPEEKNNA